MDGSVLAASEIDYLTFACGTQSRNCELAFDKHSNSTASYRIQSCSSMLHLLESQPLAHFSI